MPKTKLFRTSTIPLSLNVLLKGQLRFLNQKFDVTAISGAGENLEEVKTREEVRIKEIAMERPISIFNDIVSLWKLYWYFKKEKPTIVHSITPKAGLLTMLAGKMTGVPIRMHTFTGLVFPVKKGLMKQVLILMDKLLCICATNVYPEGNGVKQELRSYGITRKPLKVIANGNVNGVDLEVFRPQLYSVEENNALKQKIGIQENDFVFVFIGRFVKDKGLVELINAFKKVHEIQNSDVEAQEPKVKLLLVGMYEAHLDPLPKNILEEIKNNPDIIEVGFQKDVRPYFAISDVEILPSYKEGFPNVILQAGAMGLPCIVSDISGSNEIITNGKNGWIIPARNTEALAKIMQESIAEIRNRKTIIAEVARRNIIEKYDQKIVWEALQNEYIRLLTSLK